jgi:hypothetical protein
MPKKKVQKEVGGQRGFVIGLLAVCLVTMLSVSGVALASESFKSMLARAVAPLLAADIAESLNLDDTSFGGFDPINGDDSASGFTDVNVTNDLRVQGEFVSTGGFLASSTAQFTGALTTYSSATIGGIIDQTTSTATTTSGLFVSIVPGTSATSTLGAGNVDGDITAGCLELVTAAGAYVRTYVPSGATALVTEAGRCHD